MLWSGAPEKLDLNIWQVMHAPVQIDVVLRLAIAISCALIFSFGFGAASRAWVRVPATALFVLSSLLLLAAALELSPFGDGGIGWASGVGGIPGPDGRGAYVFSQPADTCFVLCWIGWTVLGAVAAGVLRWSPATSTALHASSPASRDQR